jgi:hypothetical protein
VIIGLGDWGAEEMRGKWQGQARLLRPSRGAKGVTGMRK